MRQECEQLTPRKAPRKRPDRTVVAVTLTVLLVLGTAAILLHGALEKDADHESGDTPIAAAKEKEPPKRPANPQTQREHLIANSYDFLGIPYKYGGKTTARLDCSGFTKLVYESVGIELPDGSFNQAESSRAFTSEKDLAPGDLLFYRWKDKKTISHVTMYLGDGWVIGTGSPGQIHEVTIYPLSDDLRLVKRGATMWYRHIPLAGE